MLSHGISQGSVLTSLRCGEICNDRLIADFPVSVAVKGFQNMSIVGKDMDKSLVSCFYDYRDVRS